MAPAIVPLAYCAFSDTSREGLHSHYPMGRSPCGPRARGNFRNSQPRRSNSKTEKRNGKTASKQGYYRSGESQSRAREGMPGMRCVVSATDRSNAVRPRTRGDARSAGLTASSTSIGERLPARPNRVSATLRAPRLPLWMGLEPTLGVAGGPLIRRPV